MSLNHCVAAAVLAAIVPSVSGTVIHVPDDQPTIQAGIDAAVDGDEVEVAPGTYIEAIDFDNKAITVRSSGGPDVTTIDGNGALHVVQCVSGEGPDTVLEGFTITGGNANGSFPDDRGGGMYNNAGSSPTVVTCIFTGNLGRGAMANDQLSQPTVIDCTFSGNGSIDRPGGGIYNRFSSPTVTDCTFSDNTAQVGGGIYNDNLSSPTVTDCTFSGNTTNLGGGGIYNEINCSPIVSGCMFSNNTGSSGAGINSSGGTPTMTNCTFRANVSVSAGGAVYNLSSSPTLTNCTFIDNLSSASVGGAMYNFTSSPTLINCTFSGNTAANTGGGMYNDSNSSPVLANCILWGNLPNQLLDQASASTTVSWSNVEGGWPGPGNVDLDPIFVNAPGGDVHLSPGSPCNDAGFNAAILGVADTDRDGNPRFADDVAAADAGCGVPVIVDMGAYELQGTPFAAVPGDVDGSGDVGITDLLALLGAWGACTSDCCLADLDLDQSVGVTDLLLLLALWG